MARMIETLRFKRSIRSTPSEIYRAFTHPVALRDWLADFAHAEPIKGGAIYLSWRSGYYASGEFTTLDPGRKVAIGWLGRGDPERTRVQVTLVPDGDNTLVTLTHAGFGQEKKWASARQAIAQGWETGLSNLQSVLETGIDLRYARLPRLGIQIADAYDAEQAATLRVPVTYGVRLEGTAEGTGARAAGLQKDDVIVSLAGKRIVTLHSFDSALAGHHAGDRVPVVYYRDGARLRAMLELSARPLPEVMPLAALVQSARKNYAEVERQLAEMLEGVGEAEGEYRPAPGEWNVKEIIAHLIACERDLQTWIANMVRDNLINESLEASPNVTPRLQAIVKRYPTLPALTREFECAAEETIDFIAALPPEFIARKSLYVRVVNWVTVFGHNHLSEAHAEQIRSTLRGAKSQ